MNPSFEAFVDPPDGFHEKPGTRSNREGQFSPPEARMVVEPRMQLLGLCSFDARRESRFLVLGARKRRFFGARSPREGFAKAPRAPSFGKDSSDNDKPPELLWIQGWASRNL